MKAGLSFFSLLVISLTGLSNAQGSNPCSGLWTGEIVAHPDRCDAYYVCFFTVPNLRTCESDHVFDLSVKTCVPGNQETCEIFEPTTTTLVPPLPPSLPEICDGVFFAARPFPGSITQYVGCIRGSGLLFACHDNEIFDLNANECLEVIPPTSETPETEASAP